MISMERIYKSVFNSLHAGYLSMLLLLSADFFSKLTFSNIYFRNTIKVSNGSDPDQDRHFRKS